MTPLPMNFTPILAAFAHPSPLRVWDTTGTRNAYGSWVESEPTERAASVEAIVLALSPRELEFLGEGEAASSGISITTTAELHFTDAVNLSSDAFGKEVETRQSYVLYNGQRYRVTGTGLMMGNTTMHIYHALRHIL